MSDEKKLMGIPFKMLRMEDERTGLSPADITIWKATHPDTKYADVPTTEEVANAETCPCPCHRGDIGNCTCECVDDTDDTDEIVYPQTEEDRLRQLLTSWCKAIMQYFCQRSDA